MKTTLRDRLYAKLTTTQPDRCWEFTGGTNGVGYGLLYTHSTGRRSHSDGAHRISYRLHVGPIPRGMFVCHRCDNRACCNPAHLFLGTAADNMRDKSQKGRALPGPTASPDWWTNERRHRQAGAQAAYAKTARERQARRAGKPADWRRCRACRRWKSPDQLVTRRERVLGICRACKHEADIVRRRKRGGLADVPRRRTRSDRVYV